MQKGGESRQKVGAGAANASSNRYKIDVHSTRESLQDAFDNTPFFLQNWQMKGSRIRRRVR
eukprot:scaffold17035_cov66-Attheya_sp.AAC.1